MESAADIVTITLNPAIDRTVFLEGFRAGRVNRVSRQHSQPGGKGVNVSSMLGQYGLPNTATGFLGRDNRKIFDGLFSHLPFRDEFIGVSGKTRTGIKIVDETTRETTDINFPGLTPTSADIGRFEQKLRELVRPGRWFVLAGSLPNGLAPGYVAEILSILKSGGARVAMDADGEALSVAIEHGVDLVKPNVHELAGYLGRELPDLGAQIAAARELQRDKVPQVILTLGADGALFFTPDAAFMANAPPVDVISTVGAGDAVLAGYLAGLTTGLAPDVRVRLAMVFAWCSLESVSRTLPGAEEILRRLPMIGVRSLER